MATRTWANSSYRGAVEQVAGRTWANSGGAGAHENQAVAAGGDGTDIPYPASALPPLPPVQVIGY